MGFLLRTVITAIAFWVASQVVPGEAASSMRAMAGIAVSSPSKSNRGA